MGGGYYDGGVGAEFPGELGAEFPGELGQDAVMASMLERRDPRIEDLMLGSGPEGWTIPAGTTQEFELNPRLCYRGHRLVFTPASTGTADLGAFFATACASININARDQVITRTPVPVSIWGQDATHVLGGDVMRPGVGAVIRLTNFGAVDAVIRASLYGEAVRPDVPVEEAVQLLRSSPRADLALRVRSPYEDLVGAGELLTLTVPAGATVGEEVDSQINPKLRWRASRIIWVGRTLADVGDDIAGGIWLPSGYAGVLPGRAVMSQFQIATQDQILAGAMDLASMGSNATWRVKGTIMDPGNGAYVSATPILDNSAGENPQTVQVQPIVFGRADTAT